ncbi:hypothetical protein EV201_1257 [Ancylomarina subtilis]|uniref:Uncharacterized protein n=1 Tax=Ancylomarina subtilis TaxID=1639035 RepID=A0A4Q7VK61_9BACT|nr:cell envelope integrity protein TolA [Ancylomarina subtilis]RZT96616.1 hypothetical protein EV201_1257 [Ancylomarina subtilis]
MSDENKLELILTIDKGNANSVLDETTKKILETKKFQQQLNAMLKDGSITQLQHAKSTALNKAQLQEINRTQKSAVNIIQTNNGSIKQLSNSLNANRQAYDNLSKEQRENVEIGGKLLQTIQDQSDELKGLREETGRHQDSVGDYKNKMKEALAECNLFTGGLGAMGGGFGQGITAVRKFLPMLKSLKVALIGTGIGAIVIALAALFQWFNKTEKGAQKLRVITAALGAVMGELMDFVINLGESIFNAFENPKKTVQELGTSIKNFVLDKVKSLTEGLGFLGSAFKKMMKGDFKGALEDGKKGVKGLFDASPMGMFVDTVTKGYDKIKKKGKELVDDTKKAIDLQAAENKLIQDRRNFLVEEAKLNVAKNTALTNAADQTKTAAEKQEALAAAEAATNELFEKKIAMAQAELDIKKERNNLAASGEEDLEEEAQLAAALIQLEADKQAALKEIAGQKTGLQKAENDKQVADKKKQTEEEQKIEQERRDNDAAYKAEQKELEEEEYLLGLETEEERYLAKLELDQEKDLAEIDRSKYTEEQKAKLKAAIIKKYDKAELAYKTESAKKQTEINNLANKGKIDGTKKVFGLMGEAANENTVFAKTAAVGDASINTYQAINSVLADKTVPTWAKIPMSITIGGMGLKNVAKISGISTPKKKTTLAKAETGGWISGNRHYSGGTILEAETDEFIVNRKTMTNPAMAATVVELNNAGNENREANVGISEERVIELASQVVKAIPVNITEHSITEKQTEVKERNERFVITND